MKNITKMNVAILFMNIEFVIIIPVKNKIDNLLKII